MRVYDAHVKAGSGLGALSGCSWRHCKSFGVFVGEYAYKAPLPKERRSDERRYERRKRTMKLCQKHRDRFVEKFHAKVG